MDAEIYKKIVIANGCLFKWDVNPFFIPKPGQVQFCLIFNYYFIYKNIPTNYMEAAIIVHDLLSILSYQCLFSTDIKHGYWAVNRYPDNYYYLIFHIPGIGQI